jgi:hypothetical protein
MSQQATHSERAATVYLARVRGWLAIEAARVLFTRRLAVRTSLPRISFTFDDFPQASEGQPALCTTECTFVSCENLTTLQHSEASVPEVLCAGGS